MAHWDVFHGESLELERGLGSDEVRAALASGRLRDDDLARPAGSATPWLPISQIDELISEQRSLADAPPAPSIREAEPSAETPPSDLPEEPDDVSFPVITDPSLTTSEKLAEPVTQAPESEQQSFRLTPEEPKDPSLSAPAWVWDEDYDEEDSAEAVITGASGIVEQPSEPSPSGQFSLSEEDAFARINDEDFDSELEILPDDLDVGSFTSRGSERSSTVALPVVASRDWDPSLLAEVDKAEEEPFTFARSATNTVEELDLAPMVDVAFQLVLFFMVTATTVLYKTLEVPKPSSDNPPEAVAQGRSKTLDDMREEYIVVQIDAGGTFQIDREPVAADMTVLTERLRSTRDSTARSRMLLSTDYSTPHRYAVLAIDAANEIGLAIAVAKPQGKQAAAAPPTLFPINPPAGQPATEATGKGS